MHEKKMFSPANEENRLLETEAKSGEQTVGMSPDSPPSRFARFKNMFSLRTLFLVCASLSLGFLISAIMLDSQIVTHSGYSVHFDRLNVEVALPETRVGAISIGVDIDGTKSTFKYSELSALDGKDATRSIDDKSIQTFLSSSLESSLGFKLPITSIEYASSAGLVVRICEILALSFTGLAIILQLIFRKTPDSFVLKPTITINFSLRRIETLKSGLPGFFLLLSVVSLMILTAVTSSFIHNMVYRLIAYGIFNAGADGGSLARFRVSMKGSTVSAKKEQLKLMQFIGEYLNKKEIVGFGLSFFFILIAVAINLFVLFALFYRDHRIARAKTAEAAATAAAVTTLATAAATSASIVMNPEDQWKALPWHIRVRPLWVGALICIIGFAVTAVGGNVARRRGVKMNRYPYEVEGNSKSFINDVVISRTDEYFFSTAGIVDAAVMVFMPILLTVSISAYDRIRFASKFLELIGIIFFMRGISVMATIMPTLFNVLQHPQCWDKPGNSLKDMLAEKEFCNDLMFSGHTVFAFLPALIFVYSIVYGPYAYKPFIVGSVLLTATALSSLIVVGRLHYTADVVVAIILTSLLVTMNAPVWKLQFSFRKSQTGVGSVSAIDKVPSYLELCIERLNVFTMTVQESGIAAGGADESGGTTKHTETWKKIDLIYAQMGELIDEIQRDSANMDNDYLGANDDKHADDDGLGEADTITAIFGEGFTNVPQAGGDNQITTPEHSDNDQDDIEPVNVDDSSQQPLIDNKV